MEEMLQGPEGKGPGLDGEGRELRGHRGAARPIRPGWGEKSRAKVPMSRSPLWQLRLRGPPPPRRSAFADPSPWETRPSRPWTHHLAGAALRRVRVLWARPLQTPRHWVSGAQRSPGKTLASGECGDWGPQLRHLLGAPAQGSGLRGELWRRKMRDSRKGGAKDEQTREDRGCREKYREDRHREGWWKGPAPSGSLVTGPTPLPLQAAAPLPKLPRAVPRS